MTTPQPKEKPSVLLSALDREGHPFDDVFDLVIPTWSKEDVAIASTMTGKLALVIWGGEDISPLLYSQKAGRWCHAGDSLSPRDQLEVDMVYEAAKLGIPVIGICRGAQMLCAMAGGKLVQHVDNHAGGYHKIKTDDDRIFSCPSLHHQMMYPWSGPEGWKMVAWSEPARAKGVYWGEPEEDDENTPKVLTMPDGKEPEIVWYPEQKWLCIQSHPEFIMDTKHEFIKYTLELTKKYVCSWPSKG